MLEIPWKLATARCFGGLSYHTLRVCQERRQSSGFVHPYFLKKKESFRFMWGLTANAILDKVFSLILKLATVSLAKTSIFTEPEPEKTNRFPDFISRRFRQCLHRKLMSF